MSKETYSTLCVLSKAPSSPRYWGGFDSLGVRVIDDTVFPNSDTSAIAMFSEVPLHPASSVATALPAQIAFERIFFHLQSPARIFVNYTAEFLLSEQDSLSEKQKGLEFENKEGSANSLISRAELPYLIGEIEAGTSKKELSIAKARTALKNHDLFKAISIARRFRIEENSREGWFIELYALSFMGMAEEALHLYEQYPHRGESEPDSLMIAARFRLLLKQLNEARTIFHTLSFHKVYALLAQRELARSFINEGTFDRALDITNVALKEDKQDLESKLLKAIALRGISYPSGDEEGLNEALAILEQVATAGGFNSAEALFHAGVIFARLSAFPQAELSLRQSLFQRDRFATRDALIRVLISQEKFGDAGEEFAVLQGLRPDATASLGEAVTLHSVKHGDGVSPNNKEASISATKQLIDWGFPLTSDLSDFASCDEFINFYAPSGEFLESEKTPELSAVPIETVAGFLSEHLKQLLLSTKRYSASTNNPGETISLVVRQSGFTLPLGKIVVERILVGAAGDSLSDLTSLLSEVGIDPASQTHWRAPWDVASEKFISQLEEHAGWVTARFPHLITDNLKIFSLLDELYNSLFEPGGELVEEGKGISSVELPRFYLGCARLIEKAVTPFFQATWYEHPSLDGASFFTDVLGQIFPVAKLRKRAYLAKGADFSSQLGSLELGIATAIALHEIKQTRLKTVPEIAQRLIELSPTVQSFSEVEQYGFAESLLQRSVTS